MNKQTYEKELLRQIPSVDYILDKLSNEIRYFPYNAVKKTVREYLSKIRKSILENSVKDIDENNIIESLKRQLYEKHSSKLSNMINGTGIVLHTGLGRAPFSKELIKRACVKNSGYLNLEFDIKSGSRGERNLIVEELLSSFTGAESSLVVNNNAAAVLLMLNTLAEGKAVLISRGQQVEIGGSFRIPDVIRKSGCIMREIGTTNKTHLDDYKNAISENTGAVLVVHTSNFKVKGFTQKVDLSELSSICKKRKIPLIVDLGSGAIADLKSFGLPHEPEVRGFIRGGSDLVSFSGDKLLGGPQAGIICGKKSFVKRLHKNPLYRALRVDKLTYSILDETMRTYHKPTEIHSDNLALFLLRRSQNELLEISRKIISKLNGSLIDELGICIKNSIVEAGSGSLPTEKIPSAAIVFTTNKISASKLARQFRENSPPVLGYIKGKYFRIDIKAIIPGQEKFVIDAIHKIRP